jgi:hypothetical protein
MDWLRRPVLLYHWVVRREGVTCEGEAYEPRSANGRTAVGAGSRDKLVVHDGVLRGVFFDLRPHGYSRTSLLINGVEWFPDEATCRRTGLRRRPEADFTTIPNAPNEPPGFERLRGHIDLKPVAGLRKGRGFGHFLPITGRTGRLQGG